MPRKSVAPSQHPAPPIDREALTTALRSLFAVYGKRRHPLAYQNRYQLLVMVILSAQTTDERINALAPALFQRFPSMTELAAATVEDVVPLIASVRGCIKKATWLTTIARTVGQDDAIPVTLNDLVALPGIGRKSANVIIRESGGTAEGIFVDLHVARVVPRIGITDSDNPELIERVLMDLIPRDRWNEAGMSLSYLGREICRPTDPACDQCLLRSVCAYAARRTSAP